MRPGLLLVVGTSLLAIGLAGFLLLRSGGGRAERAATLPERDAGAPERLPEPEPVRALAVPPESRAVAEEPAPPPADRAEVSASWRACFPKGSVPESGPAADELVACVRAWLETRRPEDGELAAELCGEDVPPDASRLLAAEALLARGARLAASMMVAVTDACPRMSEQWADAIAQALEREPAFGSALAQELHGERVFAPGSGCALIGAALELAGQGDEAMRLVLEQGARGEWGGTEEQVSDAIYQASGLHARPAERLAFLESVLASPALRGRRFEADALMGSLLAPRSVDARDPAPALELTRRLLRDPRLGADAARHLLVLEDFDSLPSAWSADDHAELVALARQVAGVREDE